MNFIKITKNLKLSGSFIFLIIILFLSNNYLFAADNKINVNPTSALKKNISPLFLIGSSDLKIFGLKIYKIALWSQKANFSYQNKFAIQINYNMNFNKKDLAARSISEIKKFHSLTSEEQKRYFQDLYQVFNSVKKGDEKLAVFIPNQGLLIFHNQNFNGQIKDLKLARLFVDIWLNENSSYPEVSKKLLGKKQASD